MVARTVISDCIHLCMCFKLFHTRELYLFENNQRIIMGLLDTITRSIQSSNGLPSKDALTSNLPPFTSGLKATPNFNSEQLMSGNGVSPDSNMQDFQNLYSVEASVYRAVKTITQSISQLPIQLIRDIDSDTPEVVTDRDEFSIFRRYNEYQTHYEFWENVLGYLELTGECPLLYERDARGKVVGLFPIRPDLVNVIPQNDFLVKHYEFKKGGGKVIKIPSEEVLFLKYFNPNSNYRGISPISAAKSDIILDLHAVTSVKSQFKRGAQPSGLISTEQEMSQADWDRTQSYLKGQYAGSDNAGKIMFLTHGLRWEQISMTSTEMQFMEQRQWTKDTISEVYGVPPVFLMQFREASVLANADVQYKLLWENLKPKMVKLSQIINEFLLPLITTDTRIKFNFDTSRVSPLQPDLDSRAERYKKGFAIGAVTPNDYLRDVLMKEPVEDDSMDLHYIPANVIPLEESAGRLGQPETDAIDNNQRFANMDWRIAKEESKSESVIIKEALTGAKARLEESELKAIASKELAELGILQDRLTNEFTPVLEKIFKKLKKEVMSKVGSLKIYDADKLKVDPVTLFKLLNLIKMFHEAGGHFMLGAMADAGKAFVEEWGSKGAVFDIDDPRVKAFVGERGIEYAEMVAGTTATELDLLVKRGLEQGLSINEIAGSLAGYFSDQAPMRANRIARTEAVRATNKSRLIGMQQQDFDYHMWISQRDAKVRDSHQTLDGTIKKVGASFPVGIDYNGDPEYPSDINERCGTIPVKKPKKT